VSDFFKNGILVVISIHIFYGATSYNTRCQDAGF